MAREDLNEEAKRRAHAEAQGRFVKAHSELLYAGERSKK